MLSRVANSVYWLCRYIERAEHVARFIDVNFQLALDYPDAGAAPWTAIVAATGDEEEFQARGCEASKDGAIRFLTFDAQNPNSILSCLTRARENARSVREIISSEMWEQVNRSYLQVQETVGSGWAAQHPHAFFAQVKMSSHLFAGIMDATMSHNEAWHFGRLGRLLERADKTARLVDVKYYILLPSPKDVGSPLDELQWAAVLKSASALEMYRKQRRRRVAPAEVVDFLLFDREFPRSLRWSVTKAEESLHAISGSALGTWSNVAEKRLGQLRGELSFTDVRDVIQGGLHEFLDGVQGKLNDVGDGVAEAFFGLRPAAQAQALAAAPAAGRE